MMTKKRKEIDAGRIQLAREFLEQFKALAFASTDEAGWLALKFSCPRAEAERLVAAARKAESLAQNAVRVLDGDEDEACEFTHPNPHEWHCTTHDCLVVAGVSEPVFCPKSPQGGMADDGSYLAQLDLTRDRRLVTFTVPVMLRIGRAVYAARAAEGVWTTGTELTLDTIIDHETGQRVALGRQATIIVNLATCVSSQYLEN